MENPTVVAIAQRIGKTPAQVLLKWILERGVSAIPKSTNAGRLRQNLDVYDFVLTADDQTKLRGLDSGIRVCDFSFFHGWVTEKKTIQTHEIHIYTYINLIF